MKTLRAAAICLAYACLTHAQVAADNPPHGLLILELKWSKATIYPAAPSSSPPSGDWESARPHAAPDSGGGVTTPSPITGTIAGKRGAARPNYLYTLKVKNVGAKAIQAIYWDYVSTDPSGATELGRRAIIDYQKIKPGESATLNAQYPSPPTDLLKAQQAGGGDASPTREHAEIKCVLYADATTWENPKADGSECAELRKIDKQVKTDARRRR